MSASFNRSFCFSSCMNARVSLPASVSMASPFSATSSAINSLPRTEVRTFSPYRQLHLHRRQPLPHLLQLRFRQLRALFRHLLIQHRHLQLLLIIHIPALVQLAQLLRVSELAPRLDELGLELIELGLELGAEGDEGLGFSEAGFELTDVAGVVAALGFEDAELGAELLQFGVVGWGLWGLQRC